VGMDPHAEVAILRVEGKTPEHVLTWGRSDDLMIGETVIAIGNALGQPFTVTNGIISALNRTIEGEKGHRLTNLIQTNADINRGNSGGPLVNINGDFIGLNTAILSPSGGSVGLGFAIPVFRVKKVFDYWVNNILSLEDRMGLEIQNLNPSLKRFFTSEYPALSQGKLLGVVVVQVSPQGLCAELLKRRDIIDEVDHKAIQDSDDFLLKLEEHPGAALSLGIIREGQRKTINVPVPRKEIERTTWKGLELQELSNPWRRRLDLSDDRAGLVALSVKADSPAGKVGIHEGDIIIAIEGAKMESLEDLKAAQKEISASKPVEVIFYRRIGTKGEMYRARI